MPCETPASVKACIRLSAAICLAVFLQTPTANAQNTLELQSDKSLIERKKTRLLSFKGRASANNDTYILGPGDGLDIELLDLPELSGRFTIGPDGTLYLPRLRSLFVEGLTIEELREFLVQQFSEYVRDPQIYVRPILYRPVRIYVGGEVRRPGFYTLTNTALNATRENEFNMPPRRNALYENLQDDMQDIQPRPYPRDIDNQGFTPYMFPTVFDAIRRAQGITPYTDLSKVEVTRKRAQGLGGGLIRTNLNFLSLITEGNESQNIRLFDGDVLKVARSEVVLKDQLLKAGRTNLAPQLIEVFVTGRVKVPGGVTIPQGSSLNQAISVAGGTEFLKGKVEFIRFKQDGNIDRRVFRYNPSAAADTPNNPILAASDLIRVRDSFLSTSFDVFNEFTTPFIGIYTTYSLFD